MLLVCSMNAQQRGFERINGSVPRKRRGARLGGTAHAGSLRSERARYNQEN